MFRPFAEQIAASSVSEYLQSVTWVVPTSQSAHIVSLSVLFGSAMLVNLRLLGVGVRSRTVSDLADALLPWMWRALVVLLITGVIQTITEPVRQFITPIFWLKMLLIAALALLTLWMSRTLRASLARWNNDDTRPAIAKVLAVASIAGWITVIVFGRIIGYVWANYL